MKFIRKNFYFIIGIILGLTGFKMIGLLLILISLNRLMMTAVKIPKLVFDYFEDKTEELVFDFFENKTKIDRIKAEKSNSINIYRFISLSLLLIICNIFKFIGIILIIICIISIISLTVEWSNNLILLRKKYEFELPTDCDLEEIRKKCEIKKMSININSADEEFAVKYKKFFK